MEGPDTTMIGRLRSHTTKVAALAVGLVLFATSCASNAPQDTLEPEGPKAQSIQNLVVPVFAVAGIVFVLVMGGALYVVWRLKYSAYGRAMFAQREDSLAAQAIGLAILPPRLLAFVVSAFFTAVAGSLYAHFITSFSPTVFYFDLTFRVITMLIVGGLGSVSGSVLGTVAIMALAEALRRLEDVTLLYGMSQITLAVILIVIIIYRPNGLLGRREIVLARLFRKGGEPSP